MCCQIPIKLFHVRHSLPSLSLLLFAGSSLFRKKEYLALCTKDFAIKTHPIALCENKMF